MSKIKIKAIKGLEELIDGQISGMKTQLEELVKKHANLEKEVERVGMFAEDDFKDTFVVGAEATQDTFVLTHKPVGEIRLFVDGVRYFEDCYTVNKETKTVTWKGTDATLGDGNGFELQDNTVVIEYDYNKKEEEAADKNTGEETDGGHTEETTEDTQHQA